MADRQGMIVTAEIDAGQLDERIVETVTNGLAAAMRRKPRRRGRADPGETNDSLLTHILHTLERMEAEAIDTKLAITRLVALEEERRAGERGMEALAQSLMPGDEAIDADALDWFRRDGKVWVREDGSDRAPTESEAKALSAIGALQQRRRR